MKKTLLAYLLIVSSCFFAHAIVLKTVVDGKTVYVDSASGQVVVGNGQGGGVFVNTNTGAFGVSGTANGVRFGIGNTNGVNSGPNAGGVLGLLQTIQTIINKLFPIFVGLALLAFFWFIVEFIWKGRDDPKEQAKAKGGMWWSILALFVMVSIWGLIGFIGTTIGIGQGGSIPGYTPPGTTVGR